MKLHHNLPHTRPYLAITLAIALASPAMAASAADGVWNGKTFTVTANGASVRHKYIQSATLNGKPLTKAWLDHSDIVNGGSLVLEMGSRPNKECGTDPSAEPISFSTVRSRAASSAVGK